MPNITAAADIAGIGAIKRSIRNISKVLGNYGHATFEVNHSKIQQSNVLSANHYRASFLSAFVLLK